ncbi:MAG: hypothetical protein KGS72_21105 [Cyanobacteria bacterium REEB67]|nr:hypothetical protein [Cyanobacteria bacterium REEB67]
MMITRAQWPHTIQDIHKALDGVWGLIGANGTNGNLYRLERSLHEPTIYTVTEYRLNDESDIVRREEYGTGDKEKAISAFAKEIGF